MIAAASVGAAADFGDTQEMQVNTTYQAATSGIVVAGVSWNAGQQDAGKALWGGVVGYSDANNPPQTIRGAASCGVRWMKVQNWYVQMLVPYNSFTMPVKKGDYWGVSTDGNSIGTWKVLWTPLQ
jgi:hypothetical protein